MLKEAESKEKEEVWHENQEEHGTRKIAPIHNFLHLTPYVFLQLPLPMAQRIVQVLLPKTDYTSLEEFICDEKVVTWWREGGLDQRVNVQYLVPAEETETLLDSLEQKFGHCDGFHVVILAVEACLPRPTLEPAPEPMVDPIPAPKKFFRVSREELLHEVDDGIKLNRIFIAMVVLSSIVAAIGLVTDNVAVIIGAMVIAPLLGPNMGAALATTLGDLEMIRRSARTLLAGIAVALLIGTLTGLLVPVNLESGELQARIGGIRYTDLALALASGAAGALSFTTGASSALIGVMVAVALLPPLITTGIYLGVGLPVAAGHAALLLLANLICVNLAAVGTFLLQGIRPRTWWEDKKAKHMSRRALLIWTALLGFLAAAVYYGGAGK